MVSASAETIICPRLAFAPVWRAKVTDFLGSRTSLTGYLLAMDAVLSVEALSTTIISYKLGDKVCLESESSQAGR